MPFDLNTLLAIEFVAMAAAESRRGDESDAAKRIYPGGAFDPMGMSKGNMDELKLKELKNGRLAVRGGRGRGWARERERDPALGRVWGPLPAPTASRHS